MYDKYIQIKVQQLFFKDMTDMLIVTGLIFEVLEHRADLIIVSSSVVACEALDRSLQTRFLNLNRGLIYHHQI